MSVPVEKPSDGLAPQKITRMARINNLHPGNPSNPRSKSSPPWVAASAALGSFVAKHSPLPRRAAVRNIRERAQRRVRPYQHALCPAPVKKPDGRLLATRCSLPGLLILRAVGAGRIARGNTSGGTTGSVTIRRTTARHGGESANRSSPVRHARTASRSRTPGNRSAARPAEAPPGSAWRISTARAGRSILPGGW